MCLYVYVLSCIIYVYVYMCKRFNVNVSMVLVASLQLPFTCWMFGVGWMCVFESVCVGGA